MIEFNVTLTIKTKISTVKIIRKETIIIKDNGVRNAFPTLMNKIRTILLNEEKKELNLSYGHNIQIDNFEYIKETEWKF